jgi:hypothetical protein
MIATGFAEENTVLSKPPELTADECDALSVWCGSLQNGEAAVISCWKVTAEELDAIIRTGRVWVIVLGETMPPILPTGLSPFKADPPADPPAN